MAFATALLASTNAVQAATYTASNESELITAINSANASSDAVNTITLTGRIDLTQTLPILDPQSGSQLVIEGGNNTIDGGALFVRGDLDGHEGASVTLRNVAVVDNAAVGGNGGSEGGINGYTAGGGGLGGDGGTFPTGYSNTPRGGGGGGAGGFGSGGLGGDGGFGGGGYAGGAGGFGGGGGGGFVGGGSEGGYGGGGGTAGGAVTGLSAVGGFGGARSTGIRAGGGAGMGGGLFVMEGGTLIIEDGFTVNGNTVAGGIGVNGNNGEAFGAGLFFQGSGNATFRPGDGQTQTISDVIADEAGVVAGGYTPPAGFTPGEWSLTKDGDGTLVLSGDNAYSGGTMLAGGQSSVLSVGHDNALGTGKLTVHIGTLDIQDGVTISNATELQSSIPTEGAYLYANVGTGASATHAGDISGIGWFIKTGDGTLTLSGNNTYQLSTVVRKGTLRAGAEGVFGPLNAGRFNDLYMEDAVLDLNDFDQSFSGIFGTSGEIKLGSATMTTDSAGDNAYGGLITGTGSYVKRGAGRQDLTGHNTYSGGTFLEGGLLRVGGDSALGTGTLTAGGGRLWIWTGGLVSNHTDLQTDLAINVGPISGSSPHVGTHSGDISGDGGLIKTGNGTLVLSGDSTYTGGTLLDDGTLSAGHDNAFGIGTLTAGGGSLDIQDGIAISNATDLQNDLDINVDSGATGTHAGDIDGSGGLTKIGDGTLMLAGGNTYTGGTILDEGMLSAGHDNAFGTGSLTAGGGSLDIQDGITIANATDLQNDLDINVNDGASGTHAGDIDGSGGLTKIGGGLLELTGDSTYTGPTTVNEGTLAVNGSIVSATTVNDGGRLGGSGELGAVTVSEGGVFAPGNSIGTITVNGNLTLAGLFEVEINAAGESDLAIVNGLVDLTGATLSILAEDATYAPSTDYLIIDNDGTDAVVGTFDPITTNLAFLTPTVTYDGGTGNDVVLTVLRNDIEFCAVARTRNQCNVADALDQFPVDDPLFLAVLNQTAAGAPSLRCALRRDPRNGRRHAGRRQPLCA